jgi:Lon-like protease
LPLPVYLELPGTPLSLGDNVAVGAEDAGAIDGDFLLTAVNLRPGTLARVARGLVDPDAELVRSSVVVPPGQDTEAYFDRQREVFRAAADVAAAVGLSAAGFDVDPTAVTGTGVLVNRVLPGTPAEGVLEPGDVIVEVDGDPVTVSDDLRGRIGEGPPAARALTFRRGEDERTATITPVELDTPNGRIVALGVEIQTADPRIDLPVEVTVESGRIGGPSAGLMLALTVFDIAADEDLAGGRTIAGTGTLSPEGRVGPIGGIAQKVASAERIGADVFISPVQQVDVARAAVREGSGLEVVGAATFDEALAALRGGARTAGTGRLVVV